MSLTQIHLNSLVTEQFSQSSIEFDCQCLIDQTDIIGAYNVFWIEEGKAQVNIDFQDYLINPGTFFFMNPGQIFSVKSEKKLKGIRLAFTENFYCPKTRHPEIGCNGVLFNNFTSEPTLEIASSKREKFANLMANIVTAMTMDIPAKNELVESYLKILLIECTEYKKVGLKGEVLSETNGIEAQFNRLVEEHYIDWHQIAPYAEAFAISSKSLTKKLSKLGISPSKTIQNRIIIQAKRMLFFTPKQIKEIGFELGFEEPAHFSTFFKNHTGSYPADFRKEIVS